MGFGRRGLQKVDYSQLLDRTKSHRVTANLQKTKLKSLSKQRQGFKEAWLLRLHQEVWKREWVRLVNEGWRLEVEGEEWRANALIAATEVEGQRSEVEWEERTTSSWVVDIIRYQAELYQDSRRKLEQDVLRDVQLLRANLKNWIRISAYPKAERGREELQERLSSIKLQLEENQDVLMKECLTLWRDVRLFCDEHCREGTGVRGERGVARGERGVARGVPPAVQAMECSNATLKASLMEEFNNLDQHYQLVLQQLADTHSQELR